MQNEFTKLELMSIQCCQCYQCYNQCHHVTQFLYNM